MVRQMFAYFLTAINGAARFKNAPMLISEGWSHVMLTTEQVKPFLLHEDSMVRNAAVRYFDGSFSCDLDLVPLILQSCERFGYEANLHGLAVGHHFSLTEETFDQVLRHLAQARDDDTVYHLNRMILHAPLELLRSREQAILNHPRFDARITDYLRRRQELAVKSVDFLWEELQDFARRSEDKRHVGSIDHSYTDALISALAEHDTPDAETVCRSLAAPGVEERWLGIFLIDLAGKRRLREAIPMLVEKFHIDTDYLLERCMEALARIGDPEAVRVIRAAFPDAERTFKSYTSSVLGKIKHAESEDAILFLLETESEPSIRTNLCHGLCLLFSARGVDVVRREIATGYDRWQVNLEDKLLPVAQVLGIELPEAKVWRQQQAERQRIGAERRAKLEEMGQRYQALKARGIDPFARLGGGQQEKPKATKQPKLGSARTSLTKPVPFQQTKSRVGRNDPCPCGSGKKFKICCARKG
jgi:hypothetical protein